MTASLDASAIPRRVGMTASLSESRWARETKIFVVEFC